MAYIKFRKEGEPSIKSNYIPESVKANKFRKKWKISFIISGVLNLLFIAASIYLHINGKI